MIGKMSIQSADGLRTLEASLRRFAHWWLRELQILFPRLTVKQPAGQALLIIDCTLSTVTCQLHAGASRQSVQYQAGQLNKTELERWLAEAGSAREQTRIGLALDEDQFFLRQVKLPVAAAHAMQRILEQDLVHRTPFDLDGIWHAGTEVGRSADVIEARHWIIRKDRVHTALREANLPEASIDFLSVTNAAGDRLGSIPIRQAKAEEGRWVPRAILLLAFLAVVVFVVGLGLVGGVQSRIADQMEAELLAARQSMGAAKSGGLTQFLIRKKSDIPAAAVWEDLSRLLPDDTYLTELRIADGRVLLSGVARDAPGLVKLLGRSQLFEKVSLSGPIVPVAGEGRDQFKISCLIRSKRSTAKQAELMRKVEP